MSQNNPCLHSDNTTYLEFEQYIGVMICDDCGAYRKRSGGWSEWSEPCGAYAAAYAAGLADAHETYLKSQSQLSLHLPHPDASMWRIEGRDGAAGLDVAINPDGTTFLRPVDDTIVGFCLHPEAAQALLVLIWQSLPVSTAVAPTTLTHHPLLPSNAASLLKEHRADQWAKSTTNDPGRVEGVDK